MDIHMTPVTSSQIKAIGYDAASQTLAVEFNSGLYHYYGVPAETHENLMKAESKNAYVQRVIKKAGYAYTRIEKDVSTEGADEE